MVADWQIIPRNVDLSRSADPISGWSKLTLIERLNIPDSWRIEGPPSALGVFQPGMGCILDRDGVQITSGQVKTIHRAMKSDGGRAVETVAVTFASDLDALGGRIMRPDPDQNITPGTLFKFTQSHDARFASAEGLLLYYINYNTAGAARTERRLSRLRIPTSLDRGPIVQFWARLDDLGAAVRDIAEFGDLRVRIVHAEDAGGAWLDVEVTEAADLSDDVRFGSAESTASGLLSEFEYELSAPTTTRPLVGIGGELVDREFLELRDAAAETLWGRSVESFVDQRQIPPDDVNKLAAATRAAQEALNEGAGPRRVGFVPRLGPDLEYRRDVRVGDVVGFDLPGLDSSQDKIREATTVVAVQSGQPTEQVSVVVGTPDAPRSQTQTAKALRAVTAIQRSD